MSWKIRTLTIAAATLTYSLSPGILSRAQSVTATLVGTVFDSTNAVVPQPKILLTNKGTNETRTVVGSDRGDYIIPNLAPGGQLLYSTCSVFKTENESMIDFIQEKFHLELIQMKLLKGYSDKADSMFAALLKKPL